MACWLSFNSLNRLKKLSVCRLGSCAGRCCGKYDTRVGILLKHNGQFAGIVHAQQIWQVECMPASGAGISWMRAKCIACSIGIICPHRVYWCDGLALGGIFFAQEEEPFLFQSAVMVIPEHIVPDLGALSVSNRNRVPTISLREVGTIRLIIIDRCPLERGWYRSSHSEWLLTKLPVSSSIAKLRWSFVLRSFADTGSGRCSESSGQWSVVVPALAGGVCKVTNG